ncbi:hypothetical protein, partial [Pontibacter qinzhouensis]|uniref:hypothetical protein n=1 Tax=Pontibacter qinzhouensis TaxID=2603253 RepID=UPI001C9CDA0A
DDYSKFMVDNKVSSAFIWPSWYKHFARLLHMRSFAANFKLINKLANVKVNERAKAGKAYSDITGKS